MTEALYTHNEYHNMYDSRQEMSPVWARMGTAWRQDPGNLPEMQIAVLEPGTEGQKIMKCLQCGEEFEPRPHQLKIGGGKYCSPLCYHTSKRNRITKVCQICGKEFEAKPNQLKKGWSKCCSDQCRLKLIENPPVTVVCKHCGNPFVARGIDVDKGRAKYCSKKCSNLALVGHSLSEESREKIRIKNIGRPAWNKGKHRTPEERIKIKITTQKAMHRPNVRAKITGENHPNWQGGIAFEPYCPKFNDEFKDRVRAFFDCKCAECGSPQNGERLHIHHVNFNKKACCDNTTPLFVPLCRSCHGKSGHNRPYWQQHFTDIINRKYGGKCYLPKPEDE